MKSRKIEVNKCALSNFLQGVKDMSENRRSDELSEIPIAALTPQGDFPLAAPTPPVQMAVMRPDSGEYHTLHSLPSIQERELNIIRELHITIHNASEEEIIAVRLMGGEETLIERVFSPPPWRTLHYVERDRVLPEVPKYAQAKTNKGATYAEVALAVIYSPIHATSANFVPLI